ncbi:MAG: Radical SAM domain-containing protein [Candidatus Gottesmanbacteria bacterium GW2011_GWC2_39_8]|uniref:Radical SAM domain-containing protein n=1 Tax=Candidatus Gottesmanbacteria bacterium GW2011_GWC2_39_8 TaxID=1618450 RepID=A0A0G0Q7G0_9BACT|nr:MAG: Radical SAM domain-containing protein [Candidatus Gottesmanbacteria bacterium GW2011_GWC2_39_8]
MIKIPNCLKIHFKKGLYSLIFSVTGRCNSKCLMCYYWQEIDESSKEQELSIDEITQIAKKLGRFFILFLTGGETTLREDLPEICSIFREKNNISSIFLPTNGLNPNQIVRVIREIAQLCPSTSISVLLPLEGKPKINDSIRGVNGAFECTLESIKKLNELKKLYPKISVAVNTVISNKNIKSFLPLREYVFNELGVDMHSFSPVRGVPRNSEVQPPDYKEWTELCCEMEKYYHGYLEKRSSGWKNILASNTWRYHNRLIGKILKNNSQPFKCLAGERIAVLEWDGRIRLCELTPVIGNVRNMDYDLLRVLKTPKAMEQKSNLGKCTCTHACFLGSSLPYYPLKFLRSYLP